MERKKENIMPLKHLVFWFLTFGFLGSLGCNSRDGQDGQVSTQDSRGYPTQNNAPQIPKTDSLHFSFSGGTVGAPPAAPLDGSVHESNRLEGMATHNGDLANFRYGSGESQISASAPGTGNAPAANPRKLIQNYNLEVAVKDLDEAEETLRKITDSAKGFISMSDRGNQPGQRRQGKWTIRVPGTQAEDLAHSIMKLGEQIRQSSNSRDVTEEFFDLEARLKNKKVEEERLIKILQDATGKLQEVLMVEKEISRVRGEIEQSQGRLNMLANLTNLATIQVILAEYKDYQPESAPTFGTKVSRTFSESLNGLMQFAEGIALLIVSLIPWIPVLIILFGLVLTGYWRMRRHFLQPKT